ncbi:hypothetical protein FALBO_8576 [Fusarium albosuccineum]|uniref:Uncharacterized protein n=1 Tax=Fusarium albosuccineum TaxID=1237068 RepID=A0A8H4PJD1_9HYPO|nr:hypothetical protein FALBO_8576 [Fusarium albosuccineum]
MSATAAATGPAPGQATASVTSLSGEPPHSSATTPRVATNLTVVDDPSLHPQRTSTPLALSVDHAWASVVNFAIAVLAWFRGGGAGTSSTTTLASKLQALWTNKYNLIGKTIVLLALIVACLALWPSFAASRDSRKALSLAQWDAKKSYFELCESHKWDLPGCNDTIKNSLGPPPVLRSVDSVAAPSDVLDKNHASPEVGSVTALAALTACFIVVFLRQRAVRRNLLRFCARLVRQDFDPLLRTRQAHYYYSTNSSASSEQQGLNEPLPVVFGTSSSFDFTFNSNRPFQGLSHASNNPPRVLRRRRNDRRESSETSLASQPTIAPQATVEQKRNVAFHAKQRPTSTLIKRESLLDAPTAVRDVMMNQGHKPAPQVQGPAVSPFSDREKMLEVSILPQDGLPYEDEKNSCNNPPLSFKETTTHDHQRFLMVLPNMEAGIKQRANPRSREVGGGSEVITMSIFLSMQNIVLTEWRLKNPASNCWLEGFKYGEFFLQTTDPGRLGGKVQYTPRRISQSVIVGQSLVLTHSLIALPSLAPLEEFNRFNWLLYGNERDLLEIHGGCGFSRKLLHRISQVTSYAARLQQGPVSTCASITQHDIHREQYIYHEQYRELLEMKQWSREGTTWEDMQTRPQTIEWVRSMPDNTIIDSKRDIVDVIAEAWRITAIIYLQCRLLRRPRNHPELVANMTDLAKCVRVMPTSGSYFTPQALLLPVFFLGMLATVPEHQDVSRDWFEKVIQVPIWSSAPSLYQALKRIWSWIDTDIEIPSVPSALPEHIEERMPWWEHLVSSIGQKEDGVLCFI